MLILVMGALLGGGLSALGVRVSTRWTTVPGRRPLEFALAAAAGAGFTGALGARIAEQLAGQAWAQAADLITGALFVAVLVTASLVDLHDHIIPNELMTFALALGILLMPLPGGITWRSAITGGGVGLLLLLILHVAFRGGMGMGDVKLAGVMGLYLGWPLVMVALMVGFMVGGVVGMVLLLFRVVGRKDHIAYGPFLALGGLLAVVWGVPILGWWFWWLGGY